jgi:hypothetical protein
MASVLRFERYVVNALLSSGVLHAIGNTEMTGQIGLQMSVR